MRSTAARFKAQERDTTHGAVESPCLRAATSPHLTCRQRAKARQSDFITLPTPDRWAKTDPIHRQKPAHLTERRPASKTQLA